MLRASALFYAIVIAVLIALLSGALILSAYFSRVEIDAYLKREQLQLNTMSGINLLLSPQEIVEEGESLLTDLYGSGTDSVSLQKRSWGAYEIILSQVRWRGNEVRLAALAGSSVHAKDRFALWLADHDRPLSLAGNTIIKGNAYLPKAGVQRAYIEGQSYAGEKMVYGAILASGRTIPALDRQLSEKLTRLVKGDVEQNNVDAITGDTIANSFFNDPLVIYSSQRIILNKKSISGYIMIISRKEIVVKKDALLKDVLLAAPVIRIEDEFTGALQAFAGDTLLVGKKCDLQYPSALGILRTDHSSDNMVLSIAEESKIKGSVLSWQDNYDIRRSMLISIDKKAEITGQVYAAGLLDMKGIVNGNVISSRLLLRTPSSVYENHLLNAVIDITKLPSYFGGPVIENSSRIILKWMK